MPETFCVGSMGKYIIFWCLSSYFQSLQGQTCLKRPLKKNSKNGFQYRLSLNAGQKYCRIFQGEHSALLSTCMKLPNDFKPFVLSIFEWPLKAGFTVRNYEKAFKVSTLYLLNQ